MSTIREINTSLIYKEAKDENNKFNETNEIIFWKVIHNVVLFKLIIKKIELLEPYIVDLHKQQSNRIKFKDITSMKWMLKNRQYELLKCKIIANEYIDILGYDKEEKDKNKRIKQKNQSYMPNKLLFFDKEQNEIHRTKSLEILNLLLQYKLFEMCEIDFIELFQHSGYTGGIYTYQLVILESFSLLCKNEYLILNNKSLLESIFRYLPIKIIESSPPSILQIISQLIKDKSISLIASNYYLKEENLEFLFNYPSLYSVPSSTSVQPNKKFKSSINNNNDNNNNNNNNNDNNNDCNITKIHMLNILDIKSHDIKLKLFNLGYFIKPIVRPNFKDRSKLTDVEFNNQIEQLLEQSSFIDINTIKKVHKLFAINGNGKSYLETWDEPFEEEGYYEMEYTFNTFSINVLNHILSSTLKDTITNQKVSINLTLIKKQRSLESIIEFIKLYLDNYEIIGSLQRDHAIFRFIFSIDSSELYNQLINSIYDCINGDPKKSFIRADNKSLTFKDFPKTWIPILNELCLYDNNALHIIKPFIIKDKYTIDWLKGKDIFGSENYYYYENYELADHAEKTIYRTNLNGDVTNSLSPYKYPFLKSICNCNIDEIKNFYNQSKNFKLSNQDTLFSGDLDYHLYIIKKNDSNYNNSKKMKVITHDSLIQILISLDSIEFKYIPIRLVQSLVKIIANKCFYTFETIVPTKSELSNLKIKFNKKNIISQLFIESITSVSPNVLKLFFEIGFNPLDEEEKGCDFLNEWLYTTKYFDQNGYRFSHRCIFQYHEESGPFYCASNESPFQILECIKVILSQTSNVGCCNIKHIKIYQKIINYLYKKLISSKFTTFSDIQYIRALLLNHTFKCIDSTTTDYDTNFKLENSTFHSFYHIFIKSPKLILFMMNTHLLKNYQVYDDSNSYSIGDQDYPFIASSPEEMKDYFINCLDPNIFTYEFIFKNNNGGDDENDEILELLISRFVYSQELLEEVFDEEFLNDSINSTLEFLLINHKYNLFFKQLEIISKLQSTDQQPIIFSNKVLKRAIKYLYKENDNNHNNNNNNNNNDQSSSSSASSLFLNFIQNYCPNQSIISFTTYLDEKLNSNGGNYKYYDKQKYKTLSNYLEIYSNYK